MWLDFYEFEFSPNPALGKFGPNSPLFLTLSDLFLLSLIIGPMTMCTRIFFSPKVARERWKRGTETGNGYVPAFRARSQNLMRSISSIFWPKKHKSLEKLHLWTLSPSFSFHGHGNSTLTQRICSRHFSHVRTTFLPTRLHNCCPSARLLFARVSCGKKC